MLLGYWQLTDGHQFWLHFISRKSDDTLPVSLGVFLELLNDFMGFSLDLGCFRLFFNTWLDSGNAEM